MGLCIRWVRMSHGPENKRITLIRRRWFDILLYAFGGASVWFVLDQTLGTRLQGFTSLLERCSPFVLLVIALVFVSMSVALAGIRHTRGWLGLRCFVTYPPLWLPAMLGVVLLTLAADAELIPLPNLAASKDDLRWALSTAEARLGASVLMLLVLLFGLWRPDQRDFGSISARLLRMLDRKPESERPGQPISQTEVPDQFASLQTFESIRAWIADDTEVKSVGADRFRFSDIARRIADRLGRTGEAPTIAVVGPRGSGKSTLAELTRAELRESHPNVRLVRVSLWPFDSAEAAVRGVLRKLIDELGEHAPTTALSGLSDDYAFAVEKAAGPLAGLGRLLRGVPEPDRTVNRLGDIASAVGIKLVLWVEDSERFGGGVSPEASAASERAQERLGPVHALLHLLDRCPAVSVIVADTSLSTRIDVSKIARFVERMPTLKVEQVWGVIEKVRGACLGGWPREMIDPAQRTHRDAMRLAAVARPLTIAQRDGQKETVKVEINIAQAMCHAASNPRALKSVLRLAVEQWEVLCGEVDFDSLLLLAVLRVQHPTCYAIIDSDLAAFRGNWPTARPRPPGVSDEKTLARMKAYHESIDIADSHALHRIVADLFPRSAPKASEIAWSETVNPQGFAAVLHRDYWALCASQGPIDPNSSDQAMLKAIKDWKERRDGGLPKLMCDSTSATQASSFALQFSLDELLRLTEDVAKLLELQPALQWNSLRDEISISNPLATLSHIVRQLQPAPGELYEPIRDIIVNMIPTDLTVASVIDISFATNKFYAYPLLREAQRPELRASVIQALAKECSKPNAYEWLADALRSSPPGSPPWEGSSWIIRWLVWGVPEHGPDQPLEPPMGDWDVIAGSLVKLAESKPELGVPLCVVLFTSVQDKRSTRQGPGAMQQDVLTWTGHVFEDAAARLFGSAQDPSRLGRLQAALTKYDIPNDAPGQLKSRLQAAVAWGTREANLGT
jgi:hypothetical protein